ncbi:MAG: HupE/UreJ family protein [Planctomycetota bacterium]
MSHLLVRFSDEMVTVDLRMQALTLSEVPRWSLDSDGSGGLSNFELEANWDRVATLLEETIWFEFDGQVVHPSFAIAEYEGGARENADGSFDFTYVLARATLPRPASLAAAKIHSDLFLEDGNPRHTMHITVSGLEGADRLYLLRGEERDYEIHVPQRGEVFTQYIHLGWEHVLIGFDHLAFLAALLFGVATWKRLLSAVTAFTLAHSITLALAALGIFTLPASLVEPGIAFSVLAVLILHLRRPPNESHPWIPAFAFGLLHGFGFAGVLGEIGIPPGARSLALLGFNLGVEGGQLTFVLPVVLVGFLLKRSFGPLLFARLRDWLALPTLAFAMYLVGDASLNYLFGSFTELTGRLILLAVGIGTALLLSYFPAKRTESVRHQRTLVLQAAMLLVFFNAGQLLQS